MAVANVQEKNDKTDSEVEAVLEDNREMESDSRIPTSDIKDKYLEFERDVIEALGKQNIFLSIKSNVKLTIGTNSFVFDAVASTLEAEYVIEVKMLHTFGVVTKAIKQIKSYIDAFNKYYSKSLFLKRNVKGILILPSTTGVSDFIDEIAILKFDRKDKKFTNLTEIKKWIS